MMRFVEQPVSVEARFEADGTITPLAVLWEGQYWPIESVGRRWEEGDPPHRRRCFLVMLPTRCTLELKLDTATLRWTVTRVWEQPLMV